MIKQNIKLDFDRYILYIYIYTMMMRNEDMIFRIILSDEYTYVKIFHGTDLEFDSHYPILS